MKNLSIVINRIFGLYLFFFVFFLVFKNEYFPNVYIAFIQLFMLGLSYVLIRLSLPNGILCPTVFLFQIISSLLMRFVNLEVDGDWLGTTVDGLTYRSLGEYSSLMQLGEFVRYMIDHDLDIDDIGFPVIIFITNKIFGSLGFQFMLFLNAIAIMIGAYFLNKISLRFVDKKMSLLTSLLWGMMPYSVYTSAAGLKENFFSMVVILAFYWMYRSYDKDRVSLYPVLLFFFFTTVCFLFRLAIGYMVLLSFFAYAFLKCRFFQRNLYIVAIILTVFCFLNFQNIVSFMLEQRGYEYSESLYHVAEKLNNTGDGNVAMLMNLLSGFVGPFPNFVSVDPYKITYITKYSFSPFLKILVSFFFLYSIYLFFKNRYIMLFPMILFSLLNIIMMIFTFFALHVRYHWPHWPLLLVLAACGFSRYREINRGLLFKFYVSILIFFMLAFNFR